MKYILAIFLLFSIKIFSMQDGQSNDTIYIKFDSKQSNNLIRLKKFAHEVKDTYHFEFPDSKILSFVTKTNKIEKLSKKIEFIKVNNNKIIDAQLILKKGFEKIKDSISKPNRIIYLIEIENIKRNKVVLRKVYWEDVQVLRL